MGREGEVMRQEMDYSAFIGRKSQANTGHGFAPVWMPSFLFDFQAALVEWALVLGRGAIFADCGLGKTPMLLVWAENVVRKTNGRALIMAPWAVGAQIAREAAKFGIQVTRSLDGKNLPASGIIVTNYERLHYFNWQDFVGAICDESSILKSFDGARKQDVTDFMRKLPYRLLDTATAAPNDYIELGTSSEALGYLGHMDMLMRFFKNDQNSIKAMRSRRFETGAGALSEGAKWRFKGHAEAVFWQWVCSWARACRKPSDLGFDDGKFVLPPLTENQHIVVARTLADGMLFSLPAVGLAEQRDERRRTIQERCEKVAELVAHKNQALVWCHLNDEGDILEQMIPGAIQVAGCDTDDEKEERLTAFSDGQARVLVTKQKIAGWGMNWQNCNHMTVFPSHSFEAYYQCVRRCWRFGQKLPVHVDMVTTEGEQDVLKNQQRKARQADAMFSRLVGAMNSALHIERSTTFNRTAETPAWLATIN